MHNISIRTENDSSAIFDIDLSMTDESHTVEDARLGLGDADIADAQLKNNQAASETDSLLPPEVGNEFMKLTKEWEIIETESKVLKQRLQAIDLERRNFTDEQYERMRAHLDEEVAHFGARCLDFRRRLREITAGLKTDCRS